MAMWVIAVVGDAPCQCFCPGGNHTTSPGRISSTGPPQRCARPTPDVTISVWPNGCVCHAVRAPGSKVTLAPAARAGGGASNSGSMRTVPVNHSAGPLAEGCEPLRLISMTPPVVAPGTRASGRTIAAAAARRTARLPHWPDHRVLLSFISDSFAVVLSDGAFLSEFAFARLLPTVARAS